MPLVSAPGRVNLIGEHIDYHRLPVLPIALDRRVTVDFHPRSDTLIRAASKGYQSREFNWTPGLQPVDKGDWENYLRAAAQAITQRWGVRQGIDAGISSHLPPAAGLSSSSALIVAFTLALLRANSIDATFDDLMAILPEGEHFVGTRGGGMDHAASLGSKAGCASLIGFDPLSVRHVPIPADWTFLVAHSMTRAEKSGAARDAYNARRAAGTIALDHLGISTYREALSIPDAAARLQTVEERDSFLHTTTEARRVESAVTAMASGDSATFGRVLLESHASLRDRLGVSTEALDRLVECAMQSGAIGARLTGAGFGGCAVVFAKRDAIDEVRRGLSATYYVECPDFDPGQHLIDAHPSNGALFL
jgi:galactokinase